uniref:Ubiquitin-like protease family profile domain-containing protein n=1 Tax=Astyanax mexicanus TaxID=7994 RepID=A0A3B1JWG6_ASTMX
MCVFASEQCKFTVRPFYRLENHGAVPCVSLQDHEYGTPDEATDHPYAFSGEKWEKDLGPLQEKLLKYVLDKSLPAAELIVKDDNICLTREDLWSLGLNQCMESTIGNACFKIIREAAQKHGKDVYIADMYVVPTWKTMNVDPLSSLPNNLCSKDAILFPAWSMQQNQLDHYLLCVLLVVEREIIFLDSVLPGGFGDDSYKTIFRHIAGQIDPRPWTEKTGRSFDHFPQQTSGNYCGILILIYALCICTNTPFIFTENDVPLIRQWWCILLMERFQIEGHGQRFAFWTDKASRLLQGTLQPLFRVSRSITSDIPPHVQTMVNRTAQEKKLVDFAVQDHGVRQHLLVCLSHINNVCYLQFAHCFTITVL